MLTVYMTGHKPGAKIVVLAAPAFINFFSGLNFLND